MKPVGEVVIQEFEETAVRGLKELKAFFAYQGSDKANVRLSRARVAAGVVGAYSRLRASETNRMAVELAAARLAAPQLNG